jgi:hypothetical protein
MDIRIMELANRAVRALESIAKSLNKVDPPVYLVPTKDSQEQLYSKIYQQISSVGYQRAEKLLTGMFPGRAISSLNPSQLSYYSQALSILEAYYAN